VLAGNKGTILIVDDNRDAADTLAMLIEREGYRTLTAYDASTGLQLARDVSPDIIFHDIGMPIINGYMAARKLRSESQFAKTILVAVSAYARAVDRTRALLAGFDFHFAKPMDYEDLLQVLKQTSRE
jgi:CheY-like chemotaxis protein